MGKSASALLLILVAILAISAAPANKALPSPVFTHPSPMSPRRTLRVPLTLSKRNTTFSQFDRRSTELISLRSFQETAWIGKLAIGTPKDGSAPKVYEMVFDTGSHLTWVADSTCSNCGNLPMYDGSQSSTFKDLGGDFTVHYGDNTDVLGTWTNDLYQLGDIQFRHNFGRAKLIPDFNVREGSSGIVGLRLGKRPPYPTIIRRIGALNLLDDDVISCRFVKDNAEQAGDILFGGIDPQYIQGGLDGLTYAKATGSDWRIRIDDVQVEGRSVGKGLITLVDTGASFIRLNANIVAAIYQNSGAKFVDQRTGWIVPDPFPFDVTFVIGQAQFTVPKEDIPLRNLPPIDNMFSGAFQMNNGLLVLGIPFIKNHYVVFDFNAGSERVGIGKRTS